MVSTTSLIRSMYRKAAIETYVRKLSNELTISWI